MKLSLRPFDNARISKGFSLEREKLGSLAFKEIKSELQATCTNSIFFMDGNDPYGDISSMSSVFLSNIK